MSEPSALRQQIAEAIHHNRFPDSTWARQPAAIQADYLNCADAVLAVILPHGKFLGDQLRDSEEQLLEARQWARHGYEIGQRHCGWTDHGVAPAWLTEGWPRAFDSCEHLQQMAEFDTALSRVRALRDKWLRMTLEPGQVRRLLDELTAALQQPAPDPAAKPSMSITGYCQHCGRGDAGPTADDWEQQRKRADQVEELLAIAHETSNRSEAERARAEATLNRVRALRDDLREITGARWIADALDNILGPPTDPTAGEGQ